MPCLILGHKRLPVGVDSPVEVHVVDPFLSSQSVCQIERKHDTPSVLSEDAVGAKESAILGEDGLVKRLLRATKPLLAFRKMKETRAAEVTVATVLLWHWSLVSFRLRFIGLSSLVDVSLVWVEAPQSGEFIFNEVVGKLAAEP